MAKQLEELKIPVDSTCCNAYAEIKRIRARTSTVAVRTRTRRNFLGTLSRRGVTKVTGWLGSHALGFLTALIRPQRIKHMHTNRTPTTEKETNRQIQRLEIL